MPLHKTIQFAGSDTNCIKRYQWVSRNTTRNHVHKSVGKIPRQVCVGSELVPTHLVTSTYQPELVEEMSCMLHSNQIFVPRKLRGQLNWNYWLVKVSKCSLLGIGSTEHSKRGCLTVQCDMLATTSHKLKGTYFSLTIMAFGFIQ